MKKVLSVILSLAMCLCLSAPAMAAGTNSTEDANAPLVYSPEFPNAYIIQNESDEKTRSASTTQTVSATVFVEEEYGLDSNGNPITTSSRLLSEAEVFAIGVENFGDMECARQEAVSKTMQTRAATNARGKLTITFSGTYSITGNKVSCDLTGNASWSAGPGLFNGDTNPASGSDYMGVVWSGGFTTSSTSIDTTSVLNVFEPPVLNMCASVPNAGRVWEFTEAWADSMLGQGVTIYLTSIDVNVIITKNNMTGGGNTAEAVLKYIHTYESVAGSISIEASSEGVGGGFTLNTVKDQWAIVCTVTNIPY